MRVHILPKRLRFHCRNIWLKWLGEVIGKRTTVQIERPNIIDGFPANHTTEDEELGTDHGCGMAVTTAWRGIIDYNADPLS